MVCAGVVLELLPFIGYLILNRALTAIFLFLVKSDYLGAFRTFKNNMADVDGAFRK